MFCTKSKSGTYKFDITNSFSKNGFLLETICMRLGFSLLTLIEDFDIEKLFDNKYDIIMTKINNRTFKIEFNLVDRKQSRYSIVLSRRSVVISMKGFIKKNQMAKVTNDEFLVKIIDKDIIVSY